jgi:hypothetical protein
MCPKCRREKSSIVAAHPRASDMLSLQEGGLEVKEVKEPKEKRAGRTGR